MTYAEKLKDPRWQKKRLQILKRDKFTCQWCLDKETTLHIHHFNYPKSGNPWETTNDALVTLCKNCHEFNHINVHPVIQDLFCILTIDPKKHYEAIRHLVSYSLDFYK